MYIVTGGRGGGGLPHVEALATTETLEKDGGSAWRLVASLPSGRVGVRGVGLDHGRFMITGQWIKMNILTCDSDTWQVEERWSHGIM